MLSAAGISANGPHGPRTLIVGEVTAFPKLAKIFAATPVAVWRDYLVTRYMHGFAAELPSAVDDADFAFFGTVLAGNTKQLDRAERGVQMLDQQMGEALGKLYVARYFPPEAKAKADLLVQNLLKAYAQDINTLSWMTPATRAKALVKLGKITRKIGYPDQFRDYSALAIPARRSLGRRAQRQCLRGQSRTCAHRPAGGPQRMGHDARPPTMPITIPP